MNSISEALVYGVPMVVIPFMADQPTNARRVEELGLGKRLEYKGINSSKIKEAVFSILEDKDISTRVTGMQKKMVSCLGNQGGANIIMDYFESVKAR